MRCVDQMINDRRLLTLCGARPCRTAKDHDVGNGITTKTVRTMDTARRFTRGIKAWDHLAVHVQHLSVGHQKLSNRCRSPLFEPKKIAHARDT